MDITIKRGISAEVVATYLKGFGISEPKAKEVPALFSDRTSDLAFGAFADGKIIGILLGRRINMTIWIHLIHSVGPVGGTARNFLMRDLKYYAKQFSFNLKFVT